MTHEMFLVWSTAKDDGINKPFKCLTCGRAYKHNSTLWTHQRYECGKEPSFLCPFCPYKAKKKNNLKSHTFLLHAAQLQAASVHLPSLCSSDPPLTFWLVFNITFTFHKQFNNKEICKWVCLSFIEVYFPLILS